MEDAEPILNKAGWNIIATGYWGAVYAKEGVDYVLKLFDSRDKGYPDFLKLVAAHPNKHFPRIKGGLIRVTPYYWAVRMEKLLPSTDEDPHLGVYLICRDKGPHPGNDVQIEAFSQTLDYLIDHQELKKALDLIKDNLVDKHGQDLHRQNVMRRADGTLVIIDPV